jgi:hypothetical protein
VNLGVFLVSSVCNRPLQVLLGACIIALRTQSCIQEVSEVVAAATVAAFAAALVAAVVAQVVSRRCSGGMLSTS